MPHRSKTRIRLPVVTVGALIINLEDKVLLLKTHKWRGRYGLPGGKVHYGESLEEALKREIREETGLDIKKIRFICMQECINSLEFHKKNHFILLNYSAHTRSSKVCLNEEAQEFTWVKAEEALKMNLNQPTRVLINKYLGK